MDKKDPVEIAPGKWGFRVSIGRDPITGKYRQRHYTVAAKNLTEARKIRKQKEVDGNQPDPAPTEKTVSFLLSEWLQNAQLKEIEDGTLRGYRQIAKVWADGIGHMKLTEVTAFTLEVEYRKLRDKGLSANTIGRYHAVINGALNYAVKHRWIAHNPAPESDRPSIRKADLAVPTPAEIEQIFAAADKHSAEVSMFVRLAVMTSARRGELLALRWADVDLYGQQILIRGSVAAVDGHARTKATKTHRNRALVLTGPILTQLAEYQEWQRERAGKNGLAENPFLFSANVSCSKPWHPDTATNFFETVRKKAKVPVRLHDLRHFMPTQGLANGLSISEISYRLGHQKISTTVDIYVSHIPARDANVAAFMANLVNVSTPKALPAG